MGETHREEGDRVLKVPTSSLSIGMGLVLSVGLLFASVVALPSAPAQSREPDKTLKLFFGHTGERGEFTFKRNGRFDRSEIRRLNHFFRDWRKKEDANMDPHLLDLVWAIYRETGSREDIHVVSAYRSPQTNNMLRSRSSGVAKNSQHMLGKAMDWYLPDVPLAKLRGIAMKMQGGGVGYYPRSGSPFVHTDTGNVRAWPRMTRQQLLALFPNGNTLHLPADGKPLPGYELAVARRKASGGETVLAYVDPEPDEAGDTDRTGTSRSTMGWLKRVFPGDGQDDNVAAAAPATAAPATETPASGQPQELLAATEEDTTDPRMPRSRPVSAEEPAFVEAAPAAIETADAQTMASLSIPPLPRTRPADDVLVASLEPDATSLSVESNDAIAALAARVDAVPAKQDPTSAIELAFAAAAESPPPSDADRAILSAFASLDQSVIHQADEVLMAAVIRKAAAPERTPVISTSQPILGLASTSLVPLNPVTVEETPVSTGIVLAPDETADYVDDAEALADLIEAPKDGETKSADLAMPSPEAELYVAPEAASEVADLRGLPGPPADRFQRRDATPTGEQPGFFSKLFASLIE
jgi:uncharacterized protein YcbK (DUF882 family)